MARIWGGAPMWQKGILALVFIVGMDLLSGSPMQHGFLAGGLSIIILPLRGVQATINLIEFAAALPVPIDILVSHIGETVAGISITYLLGQAISTVVVVYLGQVGWNHFARSENSVEKPPDSSA